MSPSPSRRQCSRSANSRSFNSDVCGSDCGERTWVICSVTCASIAREFQAATRSKNADRRGRFRRSAIASTRAARAVARHVDERRELGEARVGLEASTRCACIACARAAPRLQMADDAEREVVGDDVRPRHRSKDAGHDEQRQVDAEPDAVVAARVGERAIERRARRRQPDASTDTPASHRSACRSAHRVRCSAIVSASRRTTRSRQRREPPGRLAAPRRVDDERASARDARVCPAANTAFGMRAPARLLRRLGIELEAIRGRAGTR